MKKFLLRLVRRGVTAAGGVAVASGETAAGLALIVLELAAREFLERREAAKQKEGAPNVR
jgi:hypothetical protein